MSETQAGWTKEPAWEGPIYQGCLSCLPVEKLAPMDMLIAVGFGAAMVVKDGRGIYYEKYDMAEEDFWTVTDAEKAAAADPDHDWRIVMEAPLRSRTYQRQGPGEWVLIGSGPGFA